MEASVAKSGSDTAHTFLIGRTIEVEKTHNGGEGHPGVYIIPPILISFHDYFTLKLGLFNILKIV